MSGNGERNPLFHLPKTHRMTMRIAANQGKPYRPLAPMVPALALAMSLVCSASGQEPAAPELPPVPPDESAMLPEDAGKIPNPDAAMLPTEQLPNPPPPGAIPVSSLQRIEAQDGPEGTEDEVGDLLPVTEPPSVEAGAESPDRSREVAMSQALSTGDTFLASLGGLGGTLSSPFLAGAPNSPVPASGMTALRPLRWGSFDVNTHASLGVTATYLGGDLYDSDTSVSGLFQGGLSAFYGRNKLATLWFGYDVATKYPDNPTQGRQTGSEGGSGGFDQNISLIGSFTFPELRKVRFVFGAKFASLSGIDRDTGENSKRQIATALFTTSFQYSKKTAFNLNVSMPVRQFSDAVSSTGITSTLSADTQITQKTTVGVGYTFGSLKVEDGADQIFHQTLLHVKYSPTQFLLFDATAGVDFRDRGGSSTIAPIFGLSTTWDSRHGTLVTLAAERRVFNAASAIDTNFTSTSLALGVYQRFGGSVIGNITAGYEYTEYDSFGSGAGTSRTDKLSYFSAGILVPVTLRWNFALNASAGKNESDVQAFDFMQVTFKTTLTF